jgi:hypothetical protein
MNTSRQKVLLTDDQPEQKAFYESLGYTQSTNKRRGTDPKSALQTSAAPGAARLDNRSKYRTNKPCEHDREARADTSGWAEEVEPLSGMLRPPDPPSWPGERRGCRSWWRIRSIVRTPMPVIRR